MRIVRCLDADGQVHYAAQQRDGSHTRIDGGLFGACIDTGTKVEAVKVLVPIVPREILCIGLKGVRPLA